MVSSGEGFMSMTHCAAGFQACIPLLELPMSTPTSPPAPPHPPPPHKHPQNEATALSKAATTQNTSTSSSTPHPGKTPPQPKSPPTPTPRPPPPHPHLRPPLYMTYEGPLSQDHWPSHPPPPTAPPPSHRHRIHPPNRTPLPKPRIKDPAFTPLTISDNQINARLPNIPLDWNFSGLTQNASRRRLDRSCAFCHPRNRFIESSVISPRSVDLFGEKSCDLACRLSLLLLSPALLYMDVIKMWKKSDKPRTAVWIASFLMVSFFS